MFSQRVTKSSTLIGSVSRIKVDSCSVEACNPRILVYIGADLHFPGPGEIVSIAPKRLEFPILEHPELVYLETK